MSGASALFPPRSPAAGQVLAAEPGRGPEADALHEQQAGSAKGSLQSFTLGNSETCRKIFFFNCRFSNFVLRNKHHPDLHLWACAGKRKRQDQIIAGAEKKVPVQDAVSLEERKHHVQNHKEAPRVPPKTEGTYITSEHSYQKPQSCGQDRRPPVDPGSSDDEGSGSEEEREFCVRKKGRVQCSGREDGVPAKV